ncbi:MAG: hypothetical protein ACI4A5_04310, partial [Hominilimicola sp.]
TYSNAWSGENTAGQYRYITFKDNNGGEVLKLYYEWTNLCVNGETKLGAIVKDEWKDITITIEKSTGKVTISAGTEKIETSISTDLITNIAAIELSSANSCPGPEQRALGIDKIIISQ